MSDVQRISHYSKYGVALEPDEGFAWVRAADHARIVAEMEAAHAAARAERVVEDDEHQLNCRIWPHNGMGDCTCKAAAPRTLTADDEEPPVGTCPECGRSDEA